MLEADIKKEFKDLLTRLNKENGVTLVAISKKTGIHLQKLRNINTDRSSGNSEMLSKLKEAYPEFADDPSPDNSVSDFSSKEEEYKAEIEKLRKKVEEKEARIMKLIDMMYGDREESKDED